MFDATILDNLHVLRRSIIDGFILVSMFLDFPREDSKKDEPRELSRY